MNLENETDGILKNYVIRQERFGCLVNTIAPHIVLIYFCCYTFIPRDDAFSFEMVLFLLNSLSHTDHYSNQLGAMLYQKKPLGIFANFLRDK